MRFFTIIKCLGKVVQIQASNGTEYQEMLSHSVRVVFMGWEVRIDSNVVFFKNARKAFSSTAADVEATSLPRQIISSEATPPEFKDATAYWLQMGAEAHFRDPILLQNLNQWMLIYFGQLFYKDLKDRAV